MVETEIFWIVATSLVVSILSTGCEDFEDSIAPTFQSQGYITTVRYMQSRDPNAEEVSQFKVGEIPAVKIKGCGGHTVLFIVVELATGKTVRSKSLYVRKGDTICWPLPKLKSGAYMASLRAPGVILRDRWPFEIQSEDK
ncbi:MAG: hypothetical protein ACYSWP_00580 [Planctomycetota bacterium]|jgi:hypothetical protein